MFGWPRSHGKMRVSSFAAPGGMFTPTTSFRSSTCAIAYCSPACSHGQYGGAPAASCVRPQSTCAPRIRAYVSSSCVVRVLPMPGSPTSITSPP